MKLRECGLTVGTCEAGGVLGVERVVAVELGKFQLFHVEAGVVAVVGQRADVVQVRP